MSDRPQTLLVTYERLVLLPLSLCFLGGAVLYFVYRNWGAGFFLLLMFLLVGMIGQGLPHRKRQTSRELLTRNVQPRLGDLEEDESFAFAKAQFKGAALVAVFAVTCALRNHLPWVWVLGYLLCGWFGFLAFASVICFVWAWVMQKLFRPGRASDI